jgi:MerR family copper efflux transcriptional regulator
MRAIMSATTSSNAGVAEFASYTIKAASVATGLSQSVLRIWELRYGWPLPLRKANGYRTYARHQVEDLQRVAGLVKGGMPISTILVDGLPCWPVAEFAVPTARLLPQTRALPQPAEPEHAQLQQQLLRALGDRDSQAVKPLLQRIFWSVRPCDEPLTALVPTVMALAELRDGNLLVADAHEILESVHDRCVQLMRMQRGTASALPVMPARAGDRALAALVAALLCYRGAPARLWTGTREPQEPYLLADDSGGARHAGMHLLGTVTALARDTVGAACGTSLALVLDHQRPLPWEAPAAAPA